jgi:secreted Zn-dependent insulinase-like peptidase
MNSVRNIQNSVIYRIKNSFDKEINHLVANYYQVGYRSVKNSILSYLVDLTWGSNFYYELRTVRQLGYIVRSGLRRINNILVIY